ncbi:MAG TPA: hypothetical protein VIU44_08130 [Gaiellaceae bacterium]
MESQVLNVTLDEQLCTIKVYQKFYGLYVDLYVNGTLIIGGVVGENLNRIVRSAYLGFSGDLAFVDSVGADDPEWGGLGSRFFLCYLSPADLATLGLEA